MLGRVHEFEPHSCHYSVLLDLLFCSCSSAWSGLVCRLAVPGLGWSLLGRDEGDEFFARGSREECRAPRLLQRPSSRPPCTLVASSRLRPASALLCSALRCAARRPAACWPRRVGGRGRREEGGARAGEGAGLKEHCFDSDTEHRQARAPSSAAVLHARAGQQRPRLATSHTAQARASRFDSAASPPALLCAAQRNSCVDDFLDESGCARADFLPRVRRELL